jgi:hypothetical protein
MISNIMPAASGTIETSMSGIKSFQVNARAQNFDGSPFLKSQELTFPLPNPHNFPQ